MTPALAKSTVSQLIMAPTCLNPLVVLVNLKMKMKALVQTEIPTGVMLHSKPMVLSLC